MRILSKNEIQYINTIDGIAFTLTPIGATSLGRCYERMDWLLTADKEFTELQARRFVKEEHFTGGQGWQFQPNNVFPTNKIVVEDYIDSSD